MSLPRLSPFRTDYCVKIVMLTHEKRNKGRGFENTVLFIRFYRVGLKLSRPGK